MTDRNMNINASNPLKKGVQINSSPDASHLKNAHLVGNHKDPGIVKIVNLRDIAGNPIPSLNADQFHDANEILKHYFVDRLVCLESILYFFNGKELKAVDDRVIRKIIGTSMSKGGVKVTDGRIKGTYSVLKDQIPDRGRPDPESLKVYFANGAYNLQTDILEAHNISNKNTRTLYVNYEKDARCPRFLTWVEDIFSSEPDRIQYLQQLIGWTLCRHNLGIEKGIMFLGPPRAGKGLILRILRLLHNEGATSFILGDLNDDKRLSAMRNAHVAIDSDAVGPTMKNADIVMGLFKVITSNEPLGIKRLYVQNPLDGKLNCKMIVAANSAPVMFDNSAATANRWLPLVFDKSFLNSEDSSLFEQFESELEGIANWALNGLKKLFEAKSFKLPNSSKNQLDLLTFESGSLHEFVDDSLMINTTVRSSDTEVWQAYAQWAISNGHKLGKRSDTLKAIEDTLRSKGVVRKKSILMADGKTKRGFSGVTPKKLNSSNKVTQLNCPK